LAWSPIRFIVRENAQKNMVTVGASNDETARRRIASIAARQGILI